MKTLCLGLCALAMFAGALHAEEKPRRRRRFITYEERAPRQESEIEKRTSSNVNQTEGQRALERETSTSIFSNKTDSTAGGIPMMAPPVTPMTLEEDDEEETESWITPEDLMTTEDLLEMDLNAQPEDETVEMEIVDWEELQEAMIEEEMDGTLDEDQETTLEEALEQRQEEAEMALQEDPRGRSAEDAGGLQMDSMLENQRMARTPVEENESTRSGDVSQDPVLQPVLLTGDSGPVVIGNAAEANTSFSGSRQMLTDLKSRWDPRQSSGSPATTTAPPSTEIPMDDLRDPFAGASPITTAPALGSVGAGPQLQPVAPIRSAAVVESPPPARREPIRREPTDRIQSRLGAGSF